MEKKKHYVVFKQTMVNALLDRGFKLCEVSVDRKDKTKVLYLFDNTEELQKALVEISQDFKKYKK